MADHTVAEALAKAAEASSQAARLWQEAAAERRLSRLVDPLGRLLVGTAQAALPAPEPAAPPTLAGFRSPREPGSKRSLSPTSVAKSAPELGRPLQQQRQKLSMPPVPKRFAPITPPPLVLPPRPTRRAPPTEAGSELQQAGALPKKGPLALQRRVAEQAQARLDEAAAAAAAVRARAAKAAAEADEVESSHTFQAMLATHMPTRGSKLWKRVLWCLHNRLELAVGPMGSFALPAVAADCASPAKAVLQCAKDSRTAAGKRRFQPMVTEDGSCYLLTYEAYVTRCVERGLATLDGEIIAAPTPEELGMPASSGGVADPAPAAEASTGDAGEPGAPPADAPSEDEHWGPWRP